MNERMGWRLVGLVGLALLLSAGCMFTWYDETTLTLTNGSTLSCTSVRGYHENLRCYRDKQPRLSVPWDMIAGIRTRGAR